MNALGSTSLPEMRWGLLGVFSLWVFLIGYGRLGFCLGGFCLVGVFLNPHNTTLKLIFLDLSFVCSHINSIYLLKHLEETGIIN